MEQIDAQAVIDGAEQVAREGLKKQLAVLPRIPSDERRQYLFMTHQVAALQSALFSLRAREAAGRADAPAVKCTPGLTYIRVVALGLEMRIGYEDVPYDDESMRGGFASLTEVWIGDQDATEAMKVHDEELTRALDAALEAANVGTAVERYEARKAEVVA